ncbi:hypothetical protein [Streptacidiphilus sp. EB129]|uniref:hypothetical protein n=1 Tax=Streptacidiphilus sp. EB129 TaxID=3156262 RepID=UPI003514F395
MTVVVGVPETSPEELIDIPAGKSSMIFEACAQLASEPQFDAQTVTDRTPCDYAEAQRFFLCSFFGILRGNRMKMIRYAAWLV